MSLQSRAEAALVDSLSQSRSTKRARKVTIKSQGLPVPRVKMADNTDAELVRSLELSTPNFDKERTYPGLAKQKIDKKDRHLKAVDAFAKLLDSVAAELESEVLSLSREMRETVEGVDLRLKEWYTKLYDAKFLKEQLERDLITVRETQLKRIVRERSNYIEKFADDLDGLERRRADTIGNELKLLVDRLIAIAHQLPNEIERLVESETFDLNAVLTSNRRSHAELMGLLRKKQIEVEVETLQIWEDSREKWRKVRHERALGVFTSDITSQQYTDPEDRVRFMESVKARQKERHDSRQQQIAILRGLTADNIASGTIVKAQGKLSALSELEAVDVADCYKGMDELKTLLNEEAARRVESLRKELHTYGALHEEPNFLELTVMMEEALADPLLADLWRLGGGLKPEVQSLVADMTSENIVYDRHVSSIRDRLSVLCSGFPLKEVLEDRGRLAGLDKVRNLVIKLRASPRAEILALLGALLAELDELLLIPDVPDMFKDAVRECSGEMQAEVERVKNYRPPATETLGTAGLSRTATGAIRTAASTAVSTTAKSAATASGANTTNSKRGRGTATAGGEKDFSAVDPSLVKQWNRRLGILYFASDLSPACQQACSKALSGSLQQLECNKEVDAVVTDVSATTLRVMDLKYTKLIDCIVTFLETQSQYASLCGNNVCEFYLALAKKVEAHRQQQKDLDERNADELWDLSEDFRVEREDREVAFQDSCQRIRESVNHDELRANFEKVLEVLEEIQKSYRTYHGKGCLSADKYPLILVDEFKAYATSIASQFLMSPDESHGLLTSYHRIFDQTIRFNKKFFDADPMAGGVEPRPRAVEPEAVAPAQEGEEPAGAPADEGPADSSPEDTDPPLRMPGAGHFAREGVSGDCLSGSFTLLKNLDELVASLTVDKADSAGDDDNLEPPPSTGSFVREGVEGAPWILKDANLELRSANALSAMEAVEREDYEDRCAAAFLSLSDERVAGLSEETQARYAEAAALSSAVRARREKERDPSYIRARPPVREASTTGAADSWVLSLEISTSEIEGLVASIREDLVASVEAEAYHRLAAAEKLAVERKDVFTAELEDRLRTHWPRRGRVETQIKQPREAELLGHEEKTWRYIQTIQSKAYEVQKRFSAAVSRSRESCDRYVVDMTALRNLLGGTYRNLAALQGVDARARTCTVSFQAANVSSYAFLTRTCEEDTAAVITFAMDFRRVCPPQTPGAEGGYSDAEIGEIEELVAGQCEEIRCLVEEWRQEIAAVAELQEQSLKSQVEFTQRYDSSAQDLAMSEGLGQKYGAPRRRAQERLRTEVSRDEASAGKIDALLAELEFISKEVDMARRRSAQLSEEDEDAVATPDDVGNGRDELSTVHETWSLLNKLRAAFLRRVLYLRIMESSLPSTDIKFVDPNRIPPLVAAVTSELDTAVEEDSSPASASAAVITLEGVMEEVDSTCRKETRELYESEGRAGMLGQGGVPESLQQWLEGSKERILGKGGHRERAWKRVWAQIERFEAITGRRVAPGKAEEDADGEAEAAATRTTSAPGACIIMLAKAFVHYTRYEAATRDRRLDKDLKKFASEREEHERHLRPRLGSPDMADELASLDQRELERSAKMSESVNAFRGEAIMKLVEMFTALIDDANVCSRGLLNLIDSSVRLDLLSIPPDTAVPEKRMSLKRLRKAQRLREVVRQGGEDRSVERTWPAISLDHAVEYIRACESYVPAVVRERVRLAPSVAAVEPAAPAKPTGKAAPTSLAPEVSSSFQIVSKQWLEGVKVGSSVRAQVSSAHRAIVRERDEAVSTYVACLTELVEAMKAKCDRILSQEQSWLARWRAQVSMLRQGNL